MKKDMRGVKMELSEQDKKIDYLLNTIFDAVEKIDSLQELQINYEPKKVITEYFEGGTDISGSVKINTYNKDSLERMCFGYEKDIGKVGFKGKGIRNHQINAQPLIDAEQKMRDLKNNYRVVVQNIALLADALVTGDENFPYKSAISIIQQNTGALEGGKFYWQIPLKPLIAYADNLKDVLEDGIKNFGLNELKPIYDELEQKLGRFLRLRMYARQHPDCNGLVSTETAERVLKYEARMIRKEHSQNAQPSTGNIVTGNIVRNNIVRDNIHHDNVVLDNVVTDKERNLANKVINPADDKR